MTLATGTKLGRYEIRSKIGEGGMGEVYLAQDTKLDRKVALKILSASVQRKREPYFTAEVYAGPKDKEKTIEYLERAYQDKSVWLVWLKVEDIFDFLRTDPRFQEIQRRVGPPQ